MKHKISINVYMKSIYDENITINMKLYEKMLDDDIFEETGNKQIETTKENYIEIYKLIKKGIKVAIKDKSSFLLIESNMQLIINILNDTWKIRAPKYIPIYKEIKELEKHT
jgi:hypothetical protein